jgi:glycosyltransferase involved in cell wall biosynthesis
MALLEVLYVYHDLRPGGLEIDLRNLANEMARRGHRVTVATVRGPGRAGSRRHGLDPSIGLRALSPVPSGRFGRRFGLAPGIGRLIRERRTSIVHVFACLPAYLNLAAMWTARSSRHPLVWTPMMHPARRRSWDGGVSGWGMGLFDSFAPRLARRVDAVVASTGAEAEEFERLGCRQVEVIPPAVVGTPPVSDQAAGMLRARLGIDRSPLVTIVAARREKRKGLDFGLTVFRMLRQHVPDARLLLIGSPDLVSSTSDRVHCPGRLSQFELACALRASDVVFVPSRYEAFSRMVIEAWQEETPVVVTERVGLAPTVHRSGGLVVRFGSPDSAARALARLLKDPDLAREFGEGGRRLVEERFTLDRAVARMEALYGDLAGATSPLTWERFPVPIRNGDGSPTGLRGGAGRR